jgi:hypothetical protein
MQHRGEQREGDRPMSQRIALLTDVPVTFEHASDVDDRRRDGGGMAR